MTDVAELINRRMRQVIVHSVMYYHYDESIIQDHVFDKWCVELLKLIQAHPDIAAAHPFWEDFKDFDASTGFQFGTHPWGVPVALRLLRQRPMKEKKA